MENIREELFKLQDLKYKEFHSGLCPNTDNIIGVRIPELRKIAKQIAKESPEEFLNTTQTKYYEEKMLYGLVIGYMKLDLEKVLYYLDKFVPMIDNWAVCDCCTSTYKFTKTHKLEMWNYIQKYLKSNKEFELRFAIVMIMDYYLEEEYLEEVLKIYNNIKHNGYYVKMAVAWAISMCYVKFPQATEQFLNNNNLDNFTYNKSLQKIIESYRVSEDTKQKMRQMKRK